LFHVASLFDMYRVPHKSAITPKQFKDWVLKDQSPKHFVNLFHTAQGIGDIDTSVQRVNLEQGMVFQMLAHGRMHVHPNALKSSPEFCKTLNEATNEEIEALIEMMLEDSRVPGMITNNRYHSVLRPWNIFNECDQDNSHTLDDKEVEILLWFQLRQRPSQEFVSSFAKFIDDNDDGEITRTEWTLAILQTERIKRTGERLAKRQDDNLSEAVSRSPPDLEADNEKLLIQADMNVLLDMEGDPDKKKAACVQARRASAVPDTSNYSSPTSHPSISRAGSKVATSYRAIPEMIKAR